MSNHCIKGKIIKGIGGFYYILTDEQKESAGSFLFHQNHLPFEDGLVIEAKAKGSFRHQKIKPVVGDYVQVLWDGKDAVIEKIEDRKNRLIRPPVANVDLVLIVMALSDPKPNLFLLDKLLIAAEYHHAEPVIVLTKKDLVSPEVYESIQSVYTQAGYAVFLLWNDDRDQFLELKQLVAGKTACLAGPSGVGKSTLANRLCQRAEMATGDISKKLGRGKHTTRHVELLILEKNTCLLDTPGFSSFELEDDIEPENLGWYFREFPQGACRFNTCTHRHEPDCAVRQALEVGKISMSRYENYCELYTQCLKTGKKIKK